MPSTAITAGLLLLPGQDSEELLLVLVMLLSLGTGVATFGVILAYLVRPRRR